MIHDPCKYGKCISYPTCQNKYLIDLFGCDILIGFLNRRYKNSTIYKSIVEENILIQLKDLSPVLEGLDADD